MNIYQHTAIDRTPYTYLIGWSHLDKWYYGVRFAKGCHPDDLWIKYKTSSKQVKLHIKIYGDPDILEIRKTFSSIEDARLWETKVLKRLKVTRNLRFLNKTDNISIINDSDTITSEKRMEINKKISEKKKGVKLTEEHKQNQTLGKIGLLWWNNGYKEIKAKNAPDNSYKRGRLYSPSIETRMINSQKSKGNIHNKGRKPTKESNEKRSISILGLKWWNNGFFIIRSKERPDGFKPGRKIS